MVLVQRAVQAHVAIPRLAIWEKRTFVFVSGSTSHMRDDMADYVYPSRVKRLRNTTSRPFAGVKMVVCGCDRVAELHAAREMEGGLCLFWCVNPFLVGVLGDSTSIW
jgi:orotidine-5'-phosphate decarboxylase